MYFHEWQELYLKTAEKKGHTLKRSEGYDGVDLFGYNPGGVHNGPICLTCGWAVCMHCNPDPDQIPECTNKVRP